MSSGYGYGSYYDYNPTEVDPFGDSSSTNSFDGNDPYYSEPVSATPDFNIDWTSTPAETQPMTQDQTGSGSSIWSDVAGFVKPVVGGLIQAGPGILQQMGQNEISEANLARAQQADRLNAMVELAKLKYGQKGGGGGGGAAAAAAAQANFIRAKELEAKATLEGASNQGEALQALQAAFGNIFRG